MHFNANKTGDGSVFYPQDRIYTAVFWRKTNDKKHWKVKIFPVLLLLTMI